MCGTVAISHTGSAGKVACSMHCEFRDPERTPTCVRCSLSCTPGPWLPSADKTLHSIAGRPRSHAGTSTTYWAHTARRRCTNLEINTSTLFYTTEGLKINSTASRPRGTRSRHTVLCTTSTAHSDHMIPTNSKASHEQLTLVTRGN